MLLQPIVVGRYADSFARGDQGWHFTERRVEAHIMVAFLGYCLWVCLRQKLKADLELGNIMEVPRLSKIVLNCGVGAATAATAA